MGQTILATEAKLSANIQTVVTGLENRTESVEDAIATGATERKTIAWLLGALGAVVSGLWVAGPYLLKLLAHG